MLNAVMILAMLFSILSFLLFAGTKDHNDKCLFAVTTIVLLVFVVACVRML